MREKMYNVTTTEGEITSFDFEYATAIGRTVLNRITENGEYVYEVFLKDEVEDDMGYYYGIVVLNQPIKQITLPKVDIDFNKRILTYLVTHNRSQILNKAIQLNAEVLGDEYENTQYRKGEPWASIEEAIKIAQQEIATGKSNDDEIVERMIESALSKRKR